MKIKNLYEKYYGRKIGGTTGYKPKTDATKDLVGGKSYDNSVAFAMYLKKKKIDSYRTKVMGYVLRRGLPTQYEIDSLTHLLSEIYEYSKSGYHSIINTPVIKEFLDALKYESHGYKE